MTGRRHCGSLLHLMAAFRRLCLLIAGSSLFGGCLHPVDLNPAGFACATDTDCGNGLRCFQAVCGPTVRTLIRLVGPLESQYLLFESPESAKLISEGYVSQGPVMKAAIEGDANRTAVFRLYSETDVSVLLTPYVSERDGAIANYGFADQGIGFYAYRLGSALGETTLYRLAKDAVRSYAVGDAERDQAVASGWTFEMALCRGDLP